MASFDNSFDSSFEIANIQLICILVVNQGGEPVSTDYEVQSFVNGNAVADKIAVDSNGQANVYVNIAKENYIVAGFENAVSAIFWNGETGCQTIVINECTSFTESSTDKGYFFKWKALNYCFENQLNCLSICPDSDIESVCGDDLNPSYPLWENEEIEQYPLPIQQNDTIKFVVRKANVGAGRLLAIVKDGVLIKKLPTATIEETTTHLWVTVPFDCSLEDSEYQFAFYQDEKSLVIDVVSYTPVSELGKSDGAVEVSVLNGVSPYKYTIDGFETYNSTGIFTNLAAGELTVEVIDFNCNYDKRIVIIDDKTFCERFEEATTNELIDLEITTNDIIDCLTNDFI